MLLYLKLISLYLYNENKAILIYSCVANCILFYHQIKYAQANILHLSMKWVYEKDNPHFQYILLTDYAGV